jgi:hypothetical protein
LGANPTGEVAERPKARHWKCRMGESSSRVQIPPSPLYRQLEFDLTADFFMRLRHFCLHFKMGKLLIYRIFLLDFSDFLSDFCHFR